METPWMTHKEAADYLRVSTTTLHRWRKAGSVPATKPEGVWLYHRDRLDAFAGAPS